MQVVFARPRHNYASMVDVYNLILLSGFPLMFIDEIPWQTDITVIATPKCEEWQQIPYPHRARMIWYYLERAHNDTPVWDMSNTSVPDVVDEVWAADRGIATQFDFKYVFFGGHRSFGNYRVLEKKWDIITLMAPLPRRAHLFLALKKYKLADTGSLWGEQRHTRLLESRLMIMSHQDEFKWVWPPRMMIGASYAIPMLCETCVDPGYWIPGVHAEFAPMERIPEVARCLLSDDVRLARLGAAAWRLACVDRPFKKNIEEALT
jgi:hypothetical protein